MMSDTPERRYSEEEVRKIFERATEAEARGGGRSLPPPDGFTLESLQEIGREVGIPSALIAQAAASLDAARVTVAPRQRFLGVPVGVARTLYYDRPLTDREWERLVVDLRETFDARGRVQEQGPFRQWSNGNLQALLEPTDNGERLRLRTVKGDARPVQGMGAGLLAGGAVAALLALLTGNAEAVELAVVAGTGGFGAFAINWIRLPRWASLRGRQMEAIIARLKAALPSSQQLPPPADGS